MNVIAHNLTAMNANRYYGIVGSQKAKSTEKLSSGYKINRAADDAAGLSISERLRLQIKGLNKGSSNIQDGISLCQVADGAMNEVHDMLHRMKELATQASNDSNTPSDRKMINNEIGILLDAIDQIGEATIFNTMPVFVGEDNAYSELPINPTAKGKFFDILGDNVSKSGYMTEPLSPAIIASLPNTGYHNNGDNPYVSVKMDFSGINMKDLDGASYYVNCCTNCCPTKVEFKDTTGITKSGDTITVGLKKPGGGYLSAEEMNAQIVSSDEVKSLSHVEFAADGNVLYMYDIDNNAWSESSKKLAYFCDAPDDMDTHKVKLPNFPIHIQMSSNVGDAMAFSVGELSTRSLGLIGASCETYTQAQKLMEMSDRANDILSAQRAHVGAVTNRLEHSYNNNGVTGENTSAAESRIRDTDMAREMVAHSASSIIEQAGQSILAQANQASQGVLALLQ